MIEPIGLLHGVTILELAGAVAGPFAGRYFADLGAEVIKVERPPYGDMQRIFHPQGHAEGAAFAYTSAGKKSLCLDTGRPEGKQIIHELVAYVDVVLENSTPGTMEKLGFDYETLRTLNPGLVMCSVSGFGQDGPWRHRRATDPAMQGWTGLASMTGEPDGIPYESASGYCDTTTATAATIALTCALLHKARTGQGQHVEVSLFESVLAADMAAAPAVLASGGAYLPSRRGRIHHLGETALVRGRSGYLVVEVAGEGLESAWGRLAAAAPVEDLALDARFATEADRVEHGDALLTILDAWVGGFHDDRAALTALERAGVDAALVLSPWQAIEHPQIVARGMVVDVPSSDGTMFPTIATAARFEAAPAKVGTAPRLGEHNAAVLQDHLGYPEERIAELHRQGVLHRGP